MNAERLTAVMDSLTNQTVLGELLEPVSGALERVRNNTAGARVLSMFDFIGPGVLRHLQGTPTLREQVQSLLHLEPGTACGPPLARSTWSDALSCRPRRDVLAAAMAPLLAEAQAVLPDRLARFSASAGKGQTPMMWKLLIIISRIEVNHDSKQSSGNSFRRYFAQGVS